MSQFPSQFNLYDIFNVMVFPIGGCAIALALDWAYDGTPDLLNQAKSSVSIFFTATDCSPSKDGVDASDFPGSTLVAAGFGVMAFVAAYVVASVAGAIADFIRVDCPVATTMQRTLCHSGETGWLAGKVQKCVEDARLLTDEDCRQHDSLLWTAFASISEEWRFQHADRFNALSIAMFNLFILFSLGVVAAACLQAGLIGVWWWQILAPLLTIAALSLLLWSQVSLVETKRAVVAAITVLLVVAASIPWSVVSGSQQCPMLVCSLVLASATSLSVYRWRFFVGIFTQKVFRLCLVQMAEQRADQSKQRK